MKNVLLTGLVLSTLIFGFYVRSHEGDAAKPRSTSGGFSQALFQKTRLSVNAVSMKAEIQRLKLIRLGSPLIKPGLMPSRLHDRQGMDPQIAGK